MFNLSEALAEWRREMAAGGVARRAVLDELESHLLDELARLIGDVDTMEKIHWSPRGDVVVFKSMYHLFAWRVTDRRAVVKLLGGSRVWHGGTFSISSMAVPVAALDFPQPGGFRYRIEGAQEAVTVRPEEFKNWEPGRVVDAFPEVHR